MNTKSRGGYNLGGTTIQGVATIKDVMLSVVSLPEWGSWVILYQFFGFLLLYQFIWHFSILAVDLLTRIVKSSNLIPPHPYSSHVVLLTCVSVMPLFRRLLVAAAVGKMSASCCWEIGEDLLVVDSSSLAFCNSVVRLLILSSKSTVKNQYIISYMCNIVRETC